MFALAAFLSLASASPLVAAMAACPAAELSADSEAVWIAFDRTPGNQIRFTMTLDGKPVSAILDTGVSFSVLAQRYADANGLTVEAGGNAAAIGGAVNVGLVTTRSLTLGGVTRTGGRLAVAPLPASATGSATAVDLLVGRDLTAGFALDIDYAGRRFRFLRSGRMPFAGIQAPLAISPDRLVYTTQMRLGDATLSPIVIDTGDGSGVTLATPAWRATGLTGVRTTSVISYGLAGTLTTNVGVVPTLDIGQVAARNVEVRIERAGGFSESIGVAGRIGSGFLQNYRVLLDPGAGHMVLQPGPGADQPPLRSTSGLLVGLDRDRLKVLHVMANGPAEASGWKAGETICRVDGAAITARYPREPIATWSAGTPGRNVTLQLCDGTQRSLMLRSFY